MRLNNNFEPQSPSQGSIRILRRNDHFKGSFKLLILSYSYIFQHLLLAKIVKILSNIIKRAFHSTNPLHSTLTFSVEKLKFCLIFSSRLNKSLLGESRLKTFLRIMSEWKSGHFHGFSVNHRRIYVRHFLLLSLYIFTLFSWSFCEALKYLSFHGAFSPVFTQK